MEDYGWRDCLDKEEVARRQTGILLLYLRSFVADQFARQVLSNALLHMTEKRSRSNPRSPISDFYASRSPTQRKSFPLFGDVYQLKLESPRSPSSDER